MDLDKIWYKSRPTQGALTHQISSWSDRKWPRNGAWSVSQGRRGPSNGVSKMNLFMAGGHSFWPRKLIFGYVVAQFNYPKSYYYTLLIQSSVWPRQGLKDDQSGPKYKVLLYNVVFHLKILSAKSSEHFTLLLKQELIFNRKNWNLNTFSKNKWSEWYPRLASLWLYLSDSSKHKHEHLENGKLVFKASI